MTASDPTARAVAVASGTAPSPVRDPSILEAYLEDASNRPPGRATGLLRPSSEAEIAAFLAAGHESVLPQAARSSLTGGAVPEGEVVLSVERLTDIGAVATHDGGTSVRVAAGVRLCDLQAELLARGYYYPPVPTYQEAMIGGTVSTNAGGAATFKYGVTRQWVRGLRVALFNGDVLELRRGDVVAGRGRPFHVELSNGTTLVVPTPEHRLPPLKKTSAGYHSDDPLDLVDLFVGSEGTLGVVTEVTVNVVPAPASVITALAFVGTTAHAIRLAGDLRNAAERCRRAGDRDGPDVRAIELADGRCLDLLRRHGDSARLRVGVPGDAGAAVLVEVELPDRVENDRVIELLEGFLGGGPGRDDGPLTRLFRILEPYDVFESLQLAFPEDAARREVLVEFREAVPKRVNEVLGERRRADPAVKKVGGDLIVPFDRLGDMHRYFEDGFSAAGLEFAIWGHLSDGNLHPNALPRTAADTLAGEALQLRFASEAARLGGCPLSEHGVGRSPLKQEILRQFVGDPAIDRMRAIKRALDPVGRFAPGVLFPSSGFDGND